MELIFGLVCLAIVVSVFGLLLRSAFRNPSSSRLVGSGSRLVTPRTGINLDKTPARITTAASTISSNEDDSLLNTAIAVSLINNLLDGSTTQSQSNTSTFEGGGGEFSGAGASGSWDPPTVDTISSSTDTSSSSSLTDSYPSSSYDSGSSSSFDSSSGSSSSFDSSGGFDSGSSGGGSDFS